MPIWQRIFLIGIAPQFSTEHLLFLQKLLVVDDPKLLQGAICAVDGECFLAITQRPKTKEESEQRFGEICDRCAELAGEVSACRYFLNWYDDTPRMIMRQSLLVLISKILKERNESSKNDGRTENQVASCMGNVHCMA